jgi:hypothetical protein
MIRDHFEIFCQSCPIADDPVVDGKKGVSRYLSGEASSKETSGQQSVSCAPGQGPGGASLRLERRDGTYTASSVWRLERCFASRLGSNLLSLLDLKACCGSEVGYAALDASGLNSRRTCQVSPDNVFSLRVCERTMLDTVNSQNYLCGGNDGTC